ncbi:oxidoreductase [Paraphaeosphaeria sporulosa]|uniref:Oxidoreductase n=1 Tax=Paraphaeosphaeria sporulosa TaxID=1460663 RepID=A0A177BW75_9PLEO|nr:oxidoreductase [Paraphaeosphaeria sporulosa]OAF98767.1 oxidoreductase [Paraphaeosphaeria sporulosa]
MKNIQARADFDPVKEVPSLEGKVLFITGGTAGIGAETARTLAPHGPSHIYITGRNRKAADTLIGDIQKSYASVGMTFIEVDFTSLSSVKDNVQKGFKHERLDVLMCTAGIMASPPVLSKDGYETPTDHETPEIQFATNHLAHAMLIDVLLPTLLRTARTPASDVRILSTTSMGYGFHPGNGISFAELDSRSSMPRFMLGGWVRYGHSKLANILYPAELARRYPEITSLSIHPGVVATDLMYKQDWQTRWFIHITCWLQGLKYLTPHQGCWNQVYCAAVAKKEELVNGGFYYPVGLHAPDKLDKAATDANLAGRLWEWTQGVLQKF